MNIRDNVADFCPNQSNNILIDEYCSVREHKLDTATINIEGF